MSTARESRSTEPTRSLGAIDRTLERTRWENDLHEYELELLALQDAEIRKETDEMKLKVQELMRSVGLSPEPDTAMSFDGDLSSLSVDILSIDVTVEKLETCMEETLERLKTLGQPREAPSSIMKKRTEPFDTPNAALTSASKRGVRFALSGSCTEVQNLRLQQFMRGTRPVDTSLAASASEVSWCPTTPMSSPLDGKR